MPYTDSGLDFIDILPAVPSATEGIPLEVGRVDNDIDCIVDQGIYKDGRKRRLALSLGIKRGNADEAMNSILGL